MKRRRKQPEQIFQRQVADFLKLALPFPDAWFGASAATGTSKTTGGILQGMGYKAGTPDLQVIYNDDIYPRHTIVIWLELKSASGRLSKIQEQCRDDLIAAGCKWALCRSLKDVEQALRRFGVPRRASVGAEAA